MRNRCIKARKHRHNKRVESNVTDCSYSTTREDCAFANLIGTMTNARTERNCGETINRSKMVTLKELNHVNEKVRVTREMISSLRSSRKGIKKWQRTSGAAARKRRRPAG